MSRLLSTSLTRETSSWKLSRRRASVHGLIPAGSCVCAAHSGCGGGVERWKGGWWRMEGSEKCMTLVFRCRFCSVASARTISSSSFLRFVNVQTETFYLFEERKLSNMKPKLCRGPEFDLWGEDRRRESADSSWFGFGGSWPGSLGSNTSIWYQDNDD